jgi:uncharacterized protein with FMN-binding domain
MEPEDNNRQLRTTLIVLVAVVLIVGGVVAFTKRKSDANADSNTDIASSSLSGQADTDNTVTTPGTSAATAGFKDGSYSATGNYVSPGGRESITITVTLKDGVVTDTSAQSGANDRDAEDFQSEFISTYKRLVVGKKIDSIRLSHVSGSSLTSQGFNDAVNQIKSKAQA